MLTIKAEVRKDGLRVDQKYNVKVRFTLDRQVRRLSTSLFATKNDLTKTLAFKEGTEIKRQIDALVLLYQKKCADLQIEINHYSLEEVIEHLEREESQNRQIDFIAFSQEWIDNTTVKGKKNYQSALNCFKEYLDASTFDVKRLTQSVLVGFIKHLEKKRADKVKALQSKDKRVPSNRASSLYLGSIRHLFREAQQKYNDYERNIICIQHDPFMGVKVPKQEATRKRAISPELISAIYNLPYEKTTNGEIRDSRFNLAKDCFIMSFCLIGMNSADFYNATCLEGNTLLYNRKKTKDRRLDEARMEVIIPEIIQPIIGRYRDPQNKRVFNFYTRYATENGFNVAINKGLKQIGELIKVVDLEFVIIGISLYHVVTEICLDSPHISAV